MTMKMQEELLAELLEEVREMRRYVEQRRMSSIETKELVEERLVVKEPKPDSS